MPLTRTTVAYLDAMGITPWRWRGTDRGATASSRFGPELDCLQAVAAPLASVVAEWPGPLTLSAEHPGGGLLLKILAALEQPLERFAIYRLPAARGRVLALDTPGRAVLAFAEAPTRLVTDGAELVRLPTLERMLADASAKRTAWSRLKPWIAQLARS